MLKTCFKLWRNSNISGTSKTCFISSNVLNSTITNCFNETDGRCLQLSGGTLVGNTTILILQ